MEAPSYAAFLHCFRSWQLLAFVAARDWAEFRALCVVPLSCTYIGFRVVADVGYGDCI